MGSVAMQTARQKGRVILVVVVAVVEVGGGSNSGSVRSGAVVEDVVACVVIAELMSFLTCFLLAFSVVIEMACQDVCFALLLGMHLHLFVLVLTSEMANWTRTPPTH